MPMDAQKRAPSEGLVLAIVSAGVVLASLDLFIVNVALPSIARDFQTDDLGSLSWVLNAYAIVYAALLVVLGRLADRRARQHGFLLGVAVFTLASAACGLATNVPMLVAFRIVQAGGAALLTPTSLSLILATTAPERRQRAVRTWTAVGGFAAALGPVVGGLLVTLSWRWIFFVNVPVGLTALVAGRLWLPDVPGHDAPRPDLSGVALLTGGVAALTLGLVQGGSWGWSSAATTGALVGAAILLALFAVHATRHRNPLIDRALYRARGFVGASIVAIVFSTAFGAMLLSVVLWEQDVWGWSALRSGLGLAPGPLMVPLFGLFVAGRLAARFGAGVIVTAGAILLAAGSIWWVVAARVEADYVRDFLPGMVLTGIGVGLALPTMMATATGALPPQASATGSGVVNMLRQIGLAVGVALLIAVLGSGGHPANALPAFQRSWAVIAAMSLLAGAAASGLLRSRD